jgi:hypothetical protein
MIQTNDCSRLPHQRRPLLEYCREAPLSITVTFDEDGQPVSLTPLTLEELIRSAEGVTRVRAKRNGGALTAPMHDVVNGLYDLSYCPADSEDLPFQYRCHDVQKAYNQVLDASRMHILAGCHGSALLVVFAPFSIRSCIALATC